MDRPSPPGLDLPDDFGLDDDADRQTVSWIAGGFFAALIIAIGAVLWVLA